VFKQGKEKEAFDSLLDIVRFGYMIADCRAGIIPSSIGAGIKYKGCERIRYLLKETTLPTETLKGYIEQLAEHEFNREGLINTLKSEYMMICRHIDAMITGRLDDEFKRNNWGKPPSAGIFFKPNATKRLWAQIFREVIKNSERDYDKRVDITATAAYAECEKLGPFFINGRGKIMVSMLTLTLTELEERRFKEQAYSRATRILIALRCYQRDHGELPDTLDGLVPEYLGEIPQDAYDGKPFRYSKEKKIVYSVWENMVDEGGKPRDEDVSVAPGVVIPAENGDLIFEIQF
jgi:hypothetical protein